MGHFGCTLSSCYRAGTAQPHPLQCLAIQGKVVFAAYGATIKGFVRGREVNCFCGHEGKVIVMLPFGEHLVSIDDKNSLKIWHILSEGIEIEVVPSCVVGKFLSPSLLSDTSIS